MKENALPADERLEREKERREREREREREEKEREGGKWREIEGGIKEIRLGRKRRTKMGVRKEDIACAQDVTDSFASSVFIYLVEGKLWLV